MLSYWMYHYCSFSIINPTLHGKAGGLGTVEAVVEAGVIGKRERHNELTHFLSHLKGTNHRKLPRHILTSLIRDVCVREIIQISYEAQTVKNLSAPPEA